VDFDSAGDIVDTSTQTPLTEDPPVPAELARSNFALAESNNRLADELALNRPNIDVLKRRAWWQNVGLAAVILAVLGLAALTISNRALASSVQEQTHVIRDCIDPAGQCYRDQRTRTGEIQRSIIEAQRADSQRGQVTTCGLYDALKVRRPPECVDTPTTTIR
jgi:hypothetical protein